MAGVQISGLASGINWTNIVNELVQADSAGLNQVKAQQAGINNQVSALSSLSTDMNSVSSAIFTLEDPATFGNVTAVSTTPNSTWTPSATAGTPPGTYTISVSTLATATQMNGADGVSSGLNGGNGSDVSGLTLANMPTAQPVTAGTFTINGQQIAVTTSESLGDVFSAIQTATGGDVTAAYDPGTDKVTLTSGSDTPIVLGADNDTSNLLSELQLSNNGLDKITSASTLGSLQLNQDIGSANLATAVTGVDGSGNGSFLINGVSVAYNVNTDTLTTLLGRITNSGAGVTATYDTADNRVVLTNDSTGDTGMGLSDTTGNLLAALGLTGAGAALVQGNNAQFTVNNGPTQTSASNVLTSAQLGVTGLGVTVNTPTAQTIQVTADTTVLSTAIQTFITSFNTLQGDIQNDTAVTVSSSGTVGTSILSSDANVASWAGTLETAAFSAGSGVGGAISSLDDLGIDFNGTSGQLEISDSAKLQQALTQNPTAVAAFFQTAKTGFASVMTTSVDDIINQSSDEQQNLEGQSTDLGNQITTMQAQVTAEQQNLDTEFEAMETMLSQFQSDSSTLTGMFSSSSSGGLANIASSVNNSTNSTSSGTSSTSGTSSSSTS
jgi:flagellar hook-associated protein 2